MNTFAFPRSLTTPCLVVDLSRLEANIARMTSALGGRGVGLRPHAKTHKSVRIAAMQVEAGADGITVATLDEAEVFAAAGISDIFIAYTVWPSGDKARRMRRLAERVRLRVGTDSVHAIEQIAATLGDSVEVSIEINSGAGRCGVHPSGVAPIVTAALEHGVRLVGVFTHGGHAYYGADAVVPAAEDERRTLHEAAEVMRDAGIEPLVISAGSTPTALHSSRPPVNEERPGGYVFGDLDAVVHGACEVDDLAAVVVSTVVSVAAKAGQFVIDCGSKAIGKEEATLPFSGFGTIAEFPRSVLVKLSEEHGIVTAGTGPMPQVGDVVTVVPNHSCPVLAAMSEMVVVKDGDVVDTWPVDARHRHQNPPLLSRQ
jgi:D-serine deaminase-like pyridoxal phosphate-dependent protein